MATQKYHQQSRHLLAQALRELDQGDLVQASEKGWGSAAQVVKAIAEQRGWRHRSHELLFEAVDALADEAGDEDMARLFDVASALHVNFYENWNSARRVRRGLRDVGLLLDKLEPLIDPPGLPRSAALK